MDNLNQAGPTRERVQANYLNVLERIQAAATRSARESTEIRLIAVTKSVDSKVARWLVEFGCCDLAESRPQVLWEKSASLSDLPVRWHMIGHMQRNKVKRTMPLVSVMHSLDSSRILEQIQQDLGPRSVPLKLLLEINISGEPDKTGMLISSAEELLTDWQTQNGRFPGLAIEGLMGMGSLNGGLEQARRDFESLRNLRDRWAIRYGLALKELSMGMSDDFEIAIEEGATMVRVGSTLFA